MTDHYRQKGPIPTGTFPYSIFDMSKFIFFIKAKVILIILSIIIGG